MTADLKKILHSEFIAGRTTFDWCFLLLGLAIQVLVFCLAPSRPLVIVSGIAGIFSVVLCAQGKISYYVFGFLQVITYLILSYEERFYGTVAINIFYFVTMLYGVYQWYKHYHLNPETGSTELKAQNIPTMWWITLTIILIAVSALTGWLLSRYTNDADPYLDAFATIPAIVAQILLVLGYREQWFFWFCIDIGSVWLWIRAGNWSMAALYAFWCVNCIYGFINWTNVSKE